MLFRSFKLSIGYPSRKEEKKIMDRFNRENPLSKLESVVTKSDVIEMQEDVEKITVSEDIKELIIDIVLIQEVILI